MQTTTFEYSADRGWSGGFSASATPHELDSPGTLVIAFGAPALGDVAAPWQALQQAFPQAHVVGCSTAGEIHGTKLSDGTLVVAVARFEHTPLASAAVEVGPDDDGEVTGRALGAKLGHDGLRAVLVFSDGRVVNGSRLARGLQAGLPAGVVITGGLAGDGTRFASTWVVGGGVPRGGHVVAVGLYGERVHVGHGSRGGWDPFGPERLVTRSRDNVLFELDGRPALQLYKEYLGERVSGLPATALLFPLAVREAGSEVRYVRTILGIDEASQSMTFAGDVPTGARAQLMRANFDRLVEGASDAAKRVAPEAMSAVGPHLSIAVSCVGRRLVLRDRVEEELEAIYEELPLGTAQVGFYSYGEISPLADGVCGLHNQTMTLTVVSEA